jgi:predicted HicB family RNase H-like nuclease
MMEVATEVVHEPMHEETIQRAHRMASDRFRNEPDWVTFYREVLGVDGIIDQLFPGYEQRSKFSKTSEFGEIQQMLAKLREKNRGQKIPDEATRVITVRLPKSLHEALRHEAHNHRTSMNKLCISKLLQVIADELVPSDFERRDEEEQPRPVVSQPVAQSLPILRPVPTPAATMPMTSFVPPSSPQHSQLGHFPTAPTAGAF